MIDHNNYINYIRSLGYSPDEIAEILAGPIRKMPDEFKAAYLDWKKDFIHDRDTVEDVLQYVRSAGLCNIYVDTLKDELEHDKYRGLFGWSPLEYFIREYMKEQLLDVKEDVKMVDEFLSELGFDVSEEM